MPVSSRGPRRRRSWWCHTCSSTPSIRTPAKRAGSSDAACRHGLIWDHTVFHVVRHIQRRLNHRNLAGTRAQGASITSTTTRPWPCAIHPATRAPRQLVARLNIEYQSIWGASHAHQMEALQTDEQITPITTIKRHTAAAGRARHRPRSLKTARVEVRSSPGTSTSTPQPPLNTHSPTLNSEDLVNTSCLVGSAVSTSRGPTMAAPGCHPRPLRKAHTP